MATKIVLTNEILKKITTCSYCKEHLFFEETKVYPTGNIIYGQCCFDAEHLEFSSLFGIVASYLEFPCVNHHNGCTELLPYNEVKEHEKVCTKMAYQCCPCNVRFVLNEVIPHFEAVHQNNVMDVNEYSLNINSFEKTEVHLLFSKPFLMLMYVKFDGQWLFINISLPVEYVLAKYKQKVQNLKEDKLCRNLGENNDCFQFVLPRSLDCIAKIHLNICPINTVQISFSFVHKGIINHGVKTLLEPVYFPELCFLQDTLDYFKTQYCKVYLDYKKFKYSWCGQKVIYEHHSVISLISVQVKCDCCENYIWEALSRFLYTCQHFTICHACYESSYTKCQLDGAAFKTIDIYTTDLVKLRFYCRYKCKGILNIEQIVDHEKMCEYNLLNSLSDLEFGKLCFGSIFNEQSSLVWGNRFNNVCAVSSPFYVNVNKVFLVSRDGRKCIFHGQLLNNTTCFSVEHEYDKSRFVATIRVICKGNNTIREERDSFCLNNFNSPMYTWAISGNIVFKDQPVFKDDEDDVIM